MLIIFEQNWHPCWPEAHRWHPQYVDVFSMQCMLRQLICRTNRGTLSALPIDTGCAIMKGRPSSPKVTLSCCSAYHYASLCISACVIPVFHTITCCFTCVLGLLSWAWTSPIMPKNVYFRFETMLQFVSCLACLEFSAKVCFTGKRCHKVNATFSPYTDLTLAYTPLLFLAQT